MSLRAAIRDAEPFVRLSAPALPIPKMVETASALALRWSQTDQMPEAITIDAVVRRFRDALARGSWDLVTRKEWRLLPWALWHGEGPLATDARLLDAHARRLRRHRSRAEVRALLSAYLGQFGPHRPNLGQIARLLAELVPGWDWPWRERQQWLQLFDPARAPAQVAAACLEHGDGPRAGLEAIGLADHAHEGLALAGLKVAIGRLRSSLERGDRSGLLERVLAWSVDADGAVAASVRGALGDCLLCPWIGREPTGELKERIQGFLLKHYGDPRVRRRHWLGVSEEAQAVFKRWLVKVALDQYLDVVDRLALERQWRYRRAFWMSYFRHGLIEEAQVMFGAEAFRVARQMFGKEVPCAELSAGVRYVQPRHAVLLMKIGRLVIADWSHNGRCGIWLEGNWTTPRFDRAGYTSSDVDADAADWEIRHAGAASYNWQQRVRDYIHQQTGLRVEDREFQLEGRRA